MKGLAVILVVALCGCFVAGFDYHAAKARLHEYRVVNQNLHIDMLEKEIEELEHEFDDLSPLPEDEEIDALKARLRNLEDDGCQDEHEVQCGGDVPQCINHLFVCDGHEDCHNGKDEEDYVCSDEPYKVGATIAGITSWHDCLVHDPHVTVITIISHHTPDGYTSRTYVKAVVSFEVDDDESQLVESFNAKGYWNPGRRALVLVPEEESRVQGHGIVCKFNLGSQYDADCKIGTIASKHECATFRASRP